MASVADHGGLRAQSRTRDSGKPGGLALVAEALEIPEAGPDACGAVARRRGERAHTSERGVAPTTRFTVARQIARVARKPAARRRTAATSGGHVRRRAVDESRRFGELDVEAAERRGETVAGRLAHRFLARPVAKEEPAARVRERGSRASPARARSGTCAPADRRRHRDRRARHRRRCATPARKAPGDARSTRRRGVRDVEIEAATWCRRARAVRARRGESRPPRRHAQRLPSSRAQRRAPGDPAVPQRVGAEAGGTRLLRRRRARRRRLRRGRIAVERAPPERDATRPAAAARRRVDRSGGVCAERPCCRTRCAHELWPKSRVRRRARQSLASPCRGLQCCAAAPIMITSSPACGRAHRLAYSRTASRPVL